MNVHVMYLDRYKMIAFNGESGKSVPKQKQKGQRSTAVSARGISLHIKPEFSCYVNDVMHCSHRTQQDNSENN